ncbi:hypothetical protein QM012_001725 [Aureobasidium pullulans]|uniref:Ubiquitin 3 binding protein But2 C-terminal domain-containing protein n=1 Tax=Aureobasidium pullulans TaxID=5580 RepID=A0ABR0TCB8_AURPU
MHFNTLLLSAGAISMASAATTPQYLTLGTLNSNTPSGIKTPAYSTISFPITDSKTKATTTCTIQWDWTKTPSSASWTPCKDNSFSIKVSNYKTITDFSLELQHQYNTKTGKKCVNPNGTGCTTTLASTVISKSAVGFETYCGASGACGAVGKKGVKVAVSSSKTGTQK